MTFVESNIIVPTFPDLYDRWNYADHQPYIDAVRALGFDPSDSHPILSHSGDTYLYYYWHARKWAERAGELRLGQGRQIPHTRHNPEEAHKFAVYAISQTDCVSTYHPNVYRKWMEERGETYE
jgi:hypothetical protein